MTPSPQPRPRRGARGGTRRRPAPLADANNPTPKSSRTAPSNSKYRSFQYRQTIPIVAEEAGPVSSSSSDSLANGRMSAPDRRPRPADHLDQLSRENPRPGRPRSRRIGATNAPGIRRYRSELHGLRTMKNDSSIFVENDKGEIKDLVEAEKQLSISTASASKPSKAGALLQRPRRHGHASPSPPTKDITSHRRQRAIDQRQRRNRRVRGQYSPPAKSSMTPRPASSKPAQKTPMPITSPPPSPPTFPPEKADFVAAQPTTRRSAASPATAIKPPPMAPPSPIPPARNCRSTKKKPASASPCTTSPISPPAKPPC